MKRSVIRGQPSGRKFRFPDFAALHPGYVVTADDGALRPRLAVYLHGKHPRTAAAKQARAIIEPDSLGG